MAFSILCYSIPFIFYNIHLLFLSYRLCTMYKYPFRDVSHFNTLPCPIPFPVQRDGWHTIAGVKHSSSRAINKIDSARFTRTLYSELSLQLLLVCDAALPLSSTHYLLLYLLCFIYFNTIQCRQ